MWTPISRQVHKHALRMRMDAAIGRAPPISDVELQAQLRVEARRLAQEFRERNERALLNLLSDGATGAPPASWHAWKSCWRQTGHN